MIKYQTVTKKHPICQEKIPSNLHYLIQRFWKSRELNNCGTTSHAILAYDKDEIIGFFRYTSESSHSGKFKYLYATGTYILPQYRSQGIAKKLWSKAIKESKANRVYVSLTSRKASKLINSLKQKHTDVYFDTFRNYQ